MAVFCIPKHTAAKLKEAAAKGEINIKSLYEMDSKTRNEFWNQYVNKETAQFINAGFEKAVLDEQQSSLENWVKNTFSIKDKAKKKDIIDRIGELSQSGALSPESAENFLSDLVAEKLGVTVSAEEAQEIDRRSREIQDAFTKPVDEFGLPDIEYFKKREEMNKYLQSLMPSNRLKVATSTIGRGTMLFSIKSPIVNIVGNTVQQLENRMEKRISNNSYEGKVDKKLMKAYIKKASLIYKKTGFDITRLNSYSDGRRILGEDIVHSEGKGLVRKIGRFYEDAVFKQLLSAPDVYFSSITFADTANIGATKLAKEEGLKGSEMVTRANEIFKDATSIVPQTIQGEYLRETAIADALVATFQNDTNYSSLALGIRKLFNMVSGDLRIGDQIMPFVKTPANVIGMTLDAGGVGLIKGVYKLPAAVKEMKAGNPELMRQVAKDFTRAGLGMSIAFIISSLFDPEDFIGRYPTSQSEQELLTTKKARENSLRIGGKWVSLDYFGFLGGPLVGFLYAKKYGDGFLNDLYSYGSGLLLQSANIPGFEQIKDLTTDISRLKPEEGEGITETFKKFKTSAIDYLRARTVPAFVNDIAKATDTAEREVDSKKPWEKIKSGIPGLRQTLKEKQDVFGAVIKGEPWWSVMLFGSRVQTARDNKIVSEISRLNDAGFIPTISRPEKSANSRMAQLKTQLGNDKFYEANSYFRNKYMTGVDRLIDKGSYKRLSDEDKKKAIDKIREDAIDSTLLKYHYKKPKKVKTEAVPVKTKKTGFNFKLVKAAYAAGEEDFKSIRNRITLTKNEKATFGQKVMNFVKEMFDNDEQIKIADEWYDKDTIDLNKSKEVFTQLKKEQPEWYKEKIGTKIEKALWGEALKVDEKTKPIEIRTKTEAPVVETKKTISVGDTEPAPTITSDKATETPYNEDIKSTFGDKWVEATKILKRTDKDGIIRGENTQLKAGKEIDVENKIDPKTGLWSDTAPVKTFKNKFTKETENSTDRGLFRINNSRLVGPDGLLGGKKERQMMIDAGIIDDSYKNYSDITPDMAKALWDKMLEPKNNIKMAKILYDLNGNWDAWVAAPDEWLSTKRKKALGK